MKKLTKNKGITLVALVITIIILLILAGITISTLTGSGLFENAKLAEQKSKEAQEKEEGTLSNYENEIGEYVKGSRDIDKEELITSLKDALEDDEFKQELTEILQADSMPEQVLLDTITGIGSSYGKAVDLSEYKYVRLVIRDSNIGRQASELIAVSDLNETTYEHYFPNFYWDGNVHLCAEVYIRKDNIFISGVSQTQYSAFSNMKIYGIK